MSSLTILRDVLDYIEEHIEEDFSLEDLAQVHYVSLSHLHKIFGCLHKESLKEYITKRRLSQAAEEVLRADKKIIDIAFRYGYHSYEGFSRAFKKFYGCAPSLFKLKGRAIELLPRFYVVDGHNNKGDVYMITVSNMEEYLLATQGTYEVGAYILCFDIDHFGSYNKRYGWEVGDLIIEAAASRIDCHLDEDMISYHIGADEFIIQTKTMEKGKLLEIVERILVAGQDVLSIKGEQIQFNLSVGIAKVQSEEISSEEAVAYAQNAMCKAKQEGRNKYYYIGQ